MTHQLPGRTAALFLCLIFTATLFASGQIQKAGQKSCDGALDVVPAKAMSFTRKRRPANAPNQITQPLPATSANRAPRKKSSQ